MEWVLLGHQSLIIPSSLYGVVRNGKKIQKEGRSHAYMGFPNTISSPFPEKGTRQTFGGMRRKGFAAYDCPAFFCSSSLHRHHFYAFESLLELLPATYQLPKLPSCPIASSLNQPPPCFWTIFFSFKCTKQCNS